MKKKLKGLVALIMAIAMVVSIAPCSYGAISDETFNGLTQPIMRVMARDDFSISECIEENGSFSMDDVDYYLPTAPIGMNVSEEGWYIPNFYQAESWTIWEVDEDGYVDANSKSKVVPGDYIVTEEDIKEFGCEYTDNHGYNRAREPYIEANLKPIDYKVNIYDETGSKVVDVASYNIENYMSKDLQIPDGYIGYMMTVKVVEEYEEYTRYEDVFVTSFEDIWHEREIMACFDYTKVFEIIKLVPTKKMPYYVKFERYDNYDYDYNEYTYDNVIWLEPGESIADNFDQIKNIYPHYEVEGDEWEVWRVMYCGYAVESGLDNTTTGLSIGEYLSVKFDAYDRNSQYADIWYYERMYPILKGCSYVPTEYVIPVYDMKGNKTNETVVFNLDNYDNSVNSEEYPGYYFTNGFTTKADAWVLEYDGKEYDDVTTTEDIWDVLFAKSNTCDISKARIKAVCDEHTYDDGEVVNDPTVTSKGTTKYTCTKCGHSYTKDDISEIPVIDIESVELTKDSYIYSGERFKPTVTVKAYVDGTLKTLTKDVDYTVSYSNNKNPGLATVTVTGKGTFAGTKTAQFTIKPAKVTNLKAVAEKNKINLSWNEVTGVTGYKVYEMTKGGASKLIGTTKNTSFNVTGLSEGKEYSLWVIAYVSAGNCDVVGVSSENVKATTKISLKSVSLNKTSFTYTGAYIKPVATVTAMVNGKETTLTNNTDYKVEYKNFKNPGIATVTITGKGNYYGTLTTTFTITPNWVKSVKQVAASTYTKSLRIKWESVVGVTGYEVYKSDTKNGTYKLAGTTASTEFTSKNLEVGTNYYYKVRAYKTVNGKKIYGNFSNVLKATTKTTTPSKVMTSVTSKKTNVKWYYSKGAAGYEVYMSINSKYIGSKVAATTSTVRNVDLTNLEKGKTYCVRVRAYTKTASGQKMYTAFTDYVLFKAK